MRIEHGPAGPIKRVLPDKTEADISSIFKWFKGDFEKVGA
jgi:hypothetical protein